MLAVILPPQPPPHAVLQPDLLAAEHARAVPVVVVVGPAAGDSIHPSDRLGATAVFRPVIEFFTDGIAQVQPGFRAGFHMHEAVARARTAPPREVEAEEAEGFLPEVHQPGFRFVQGQSLGGHILFQSLQHRTARLGFVEKKTNVVFCGGVGLGKSHLASALAYEACQRGRSVLFTTAVDALNNLTAAQLAGRLKFELKKYLTPDVVLLDELGYLPLDKAGADLIFQIISQRYERGSMIITTNKAYKHWPEIFNHDAGVTSAILDRVLHNAETIVIEGKSYRMKDQIEPPN